jgi:hypothetical protein
MTEQRKIIYICSPCRGNIAANVSNAKVFCGLAIREGYTPLAPHAFYTEFLNDEIPAQRAAALNIGISLLRRCDEVWVFGSVISEGMRAEIIEAQNLNMPVKRCVIYGGRAAGNTAVLRLSVRRM